MMTPKLVILGLAIAVVGACTPVQPPSDAAPDADAIAPMDVPVDAPAEASPDLDSAIDAPAEATTDPCGGCGLGQRCALEPGCDGPARYRCYYNTCGDAVAVNWCFCDGTFGSSPNGACVPTERRFVASTGTPSNPLLPGIHTSEACMAHFGDGSVGDSSFGD